MRRAIDPTTPAAEPDVLAGAHKTKDVFSDLASCVGLMLSNPEYDQKQSYLVDFEGKMLEPNLIVCKVVLALASYRSKSYKEEGGAEFAAELESQVLASLQRFIKPMRSFLDKYRNGNAADRELIDILSLLHDEENMAVKLKVVTFLNKQFDLKMDKVALFTAVFLPVKRERGDDLEAAAGGGGGDHVEVISFADLCSSVKRDVDEMREAAKSGDVAAEEVLSSIAATKASIAARCGASSAINLLNVDMASPKVAEAAVAEVLRKGPSASRAPGGR